MMPFHFYLKLGFDHIANLTGLDHILFLVVLCAVYRIDQWRKVLLLVTAFTIGHSLTLALSSFDIVLLPSHIIKVLIPVTILLTAMSNIYQPTFNSLHQRTRWIYVLTLFFGCIHGLDFSNYFKALLMDGQSVFLPLLGFNIGIELAQILVVAFIVLISWLLLTQLKVKQREWTLFVSGAASGVALLSIIDQL